MFGFLHKPGMRSLSPDMLRSLETSGLLPGTNLSTLGVVESAGRYAGRKVSYFRVFDPKRVTARAVNVFTNDTYNDLNAHLDLVLSAGHIEQDGTIVTSSHSIALEAKVPTRERANRAAHTDYDHLIAPNNSQSTEAGSSTSR